MIWVVQLSGWSLGCLLPFLSFSPSQRGSGMTGIPAPGELAWAPIYENQVPGLGGTGTGPSPHTLPPPRLPQPPRSPGAGALPICGRGFTISKGSGALPGSRLLFLSLPAASRRAAGEGIGWGSRTSPDRSVRLLSVSNGGQGRERDGGAGPQVKRRSREGRNATRGLCNLRPAGSREEKREESLHFLPFSSVPRGAAFCWSAGRLPAQVFRGGCRGTSFANKTASLCAQHPAFGAWQSPLCLFSLSSAR